MIQFAMVWALKKFPYANAYDENVVNDMSILINGFTMENLGMNTEMRLIFLPILIHRFVPNSSCIEVFMHFIHDHFLLQKISWMYWFTTHILSWEKNVYWSKNWKWINCLFHINRWWRVDIKMFMLCCNWYRFRLKKSWMKIIQAHGFSARENILHSVEMLLIFALVHW